MSVRSLNIARAPSGDAALLHLRAGPLTMFFEPENVFLRRLCYDGHEILRGIYAAVRDRNWGTVSPRIEQLQTTIREDSFCLRFEVDCRRHGIHFRWRGEIAGETDGTVSFLFDGHALTSFLRNRIGFCVLHPRACAGAVARYQRADGQTIDTAFATAIEPQLVGRATFREMRSLAHQVMPGLWAQVDFEGDLFEMEDQRNWTDASFKTYCTPLALPFPVEISAGTRISQSVRLSMRREPGASLALPAPRNRRHPTLAGVRPKDAAGQQEAAHAALDLDFEDSLSSDLPQLGLGVASHETPLTTREIAWLARLQVAHLRVDVRLARPGWQETLTRAAGQARQLGAKLEVALHLPKEDPEPGTAGALDTCSDCIGRVLALRDGEPATSAESLRAARRLCGALQTHAPIGGGTDANFCELNREQALGKLGLAEAEFLSWPITPQVHAFDNLSLIETLEAQPDTIATARRFAGQRPLVISPITLKPRFNAVATSCDENGAFASELPPSVDPRQIYLFTAAWTLGSLAVLARAGVASVTVFETSGWRGVLETEAGSPLPQLFHSKPGSVFPVYFALAALAGYSSARVTVVPGKLAALKLSGHGPDRIVVADLGGSATHIQLRTASGTARLWMLNETTAEAAVHGPETFLSGPRLPLDAVRGRIDLRLQPYAVAWLDLGR